MPPLSDNELRDIADESGLSPEQVRKTLAAEAGTALAKRAPQGMVAPSVRGATAAFAEGRLPVAPENAVRRVREAVEQQARSKGHMQGGGEADVVDEARKITYRIRAEDDGSRGALVRVDIDPTQAKANNMLGWAGVITGGVVLSLAAALTGSLALWIGAGVVGLGGGAVMGRQRALLTARVHDAHALASQAIADAESKVPALGPASGD